MPTEQTGLVLRGTLLKASPREVRPKEANAFTVYEARILADDMVLVVTFYDADEMEGALRSCKPGAAIELPVFGRARNSKVFLHYRRGAPVVDTAAA